MVEFGEDGAGQLPVWFEGQGLLEGLATHPADAFTLVFIGQTAFSRWDFEEAAEFYARALRVDTANLWANVFYPMVPIYQGKLDDAEEKIRLARRILPKDAWLTSCEALVWAKRGEKRVRKPRSQPGRNVTTGTEGQADSQKNEIKKYGNFTI